MGLKQHMKIHNREDEIKEKGGEMPGRALCNVCSMSCKNKYILKQHLTLHNSENLVCDMCTGTFKHKSNLQRHIQLTHSESKAPCSSCGQLFSLSFIRYHQKICKMSEEEKKDFKANRRVGCKDCGKILANKTRLSRHIRFIHNNEKLYKCNLCDHQDYKKDNMKTHIKGVHKEM